MDIFSFESNRRIGENNVFRKVEALLNWPAIEQLLRGGLKRSGLGPQGYEPIVLFKCLLLGQWHGLSDPKLEESLRVRLDFMLFAGLDLHRPVPDETTHCRFRVEQAFGTLKRLFGLQRARYFGIKKTHAQMVMATISSNLLKAANRITLHPKNLSIA